MRVQRFTLAAHVDDVPAGAEFYTRHFGFRAVVAEDFIAKLLHDDPAFELCLLRRDAEGGAPRAGGIVVALEVDDVEAEVARLAAAGVEPASPVVDEPWGERLCLFTDPNGLTVELVQWLGERPGG